MQEKLYAHWQWLSPFLQRVQRHFVRYRTFVIRLYLRAILLQLVYAFTDVFFLGSMNIKAVFLCHGPHGAAMSIINRRYLNRPP